MIDKNLLCEKFHAALSDPNEGQHQIDFIAKRSFSQKTLNLWGVGYCPPQIPKCQDLFPFLRGRIIVPFYDVYGRLLCFFGRKLESDAENVLNHFMDYKNGLDLFYRWDRGKWINEPYEKTHHLFGLNLNKENILKSGYAVITEGNFDVISLYDRGIQNAVATCGSQVFSNFHIALLSRYTNRVVILSDADKSGNIAMDKIISMLKPYNFQICNCRLPSGMDPEDYIRKYGSKRIQESIDYAFENYEQEILL